MSIDQDAADEALVEQTAEATADMAPDSELGEDGHAHHGYMSDKQRYLARLKRIEGQARGIHRMIDEEKYCIDILTQISALTSALEGVALHRRHLRAGEALPDRGDVVEGGPGLVEGRGDGELMLELHQPAAGFSTARRVSTVARCVRYADSPLRSEGGLVPSVTRSHAARTPSS